LQLSDQTAPPTPRTSDLGLRTPIAYRAVFEFFPTGIIVVDARGQVQGTNLRAKGLFGSLLERDRLRCCDLFDCRRAGTPLAEHCITELSLGHEGPLPELRVDMPGPGGSVRSVWVTGAPYGGAEPAVVLQVRPGVAGDRRRRTEPHWMGGPQLRVFTLGRSRVESGEGPLAGEWLGHRPGHVLKYLVCHRERVVPTDELIETFWPESGRKGVTNVRQAVHTLRDRLQPDRPKHGGSAFVASRSGGYELERAFVWIDADDFEGSVREGVKAHAEGDIETAEVALSRAAGLYRGDFLAEEIYAEWAFGERDRLREMAAQALRGLAEIRATQGDLEGATEQLHRLGELEPYDMDVQRDLLSMLVRRGRHAEAARRHELLRRRYRKTFGEEPPVDLSAIARDVNNT
jgi:DNA-binding SARP family transcriptional activator